ncbi:MAG: acetyl-CoA C-acyltransferase, partial [Betaproteobacteria bacterium]
MTKQVQEAYIVAAVRTPVGKAPRGMFKNVRPDDMLAHVLRGVISHVPGLDPHDIGDVVVGCAMPEGEQGMNVARIGVLLAGLPDSVPAVTINRFCSSGVQAISMAADRIRTGDDDVVIAAGTESMSMVPMMGNKIALNQNVFHNNEHIAIAYGMGITAENVAKQWKVSREEQDAFAVASHQKAARAIAAGGFRDEILAYEIDTASPDLLSGTIKHKKRMADTDEGPRADSSMESLAKLRTVFAARGSVTAGNSSQMS